MSAEYSDAVPISQTIPLTSCNTYLILEWLPMTKWTIKRMLCAAYIHNQQLGKGSKKWATYQGTQGDSLILAFDLAMGVDLTPAIYNAYNKR